MRDVDAVSNTTPTNGDNSANLVTGQDQLHGQAAPTHCPICMALMRTPYRKRLANDVVRRYRRCPNGCYRDTAILVTERSTTDAPA